MYLDGWSYWSARGPNILGLVQVMLMLHVLKLLQLCSKVDAQSRTADINIFVTILTCIQRSRWHSWNMGEDLRVSPL